MLIIFKKRGKITKRIKEIFNMFYKNGKKKSRAPLFLTIGALATIGAISITNCGKKMISCMKEKITKMFKREEE